MAAKKFLRLVAGKITEVFGVQTSAGVGNAGDIVALDDTGRIDPTMMPVGIGAEVKVLVTSEALAAGDAVNIWTDAGVAKARKADATTAGKQTDGYVLAAVTSGGNATVYTDGINTQRTGLTPGADLYLQTTAGAVGHTIPSAAGNVVQRVGKALSATEWQFAPSDPITLA